MRYTLAGLLPPLASVAFSLVILASLAAGAVPHGSKTIIALVSVLVCWVVAALTLRGLAAFFHIGANLIAHPSLLPLCLAACLQASNDGSTAAGARAVSTTASVKPDIAGAGAGASAATTAVVVTHPQHALDAAAAEHALHPPRHLSHHFNGLAAPRLRIILVHEAEPAEGTPAALEMERVRAQLRTASKDPCKTFDKVRLKVLLDNMATFVLKHLGLFCESRTLDAVLGAPGEPLRSAAPMTVYVFFVWTPAGMQRRAATCHLESWPTAQCATVTPPYGAVQRDAKQLLSSLNVLAGDKSGVSADSPYPGIVPAIFAAVAAKAGAVLLNTSA